MRRTKTNGARTGSSKVLLRELIPQRGVERGAPANATALSTGGKMGRYVLVVALLVGLSDSVFARDDGRYANDPLKYWFDNLTSSNGNCCSFADGLSISDVDWDSKDGHYRVLLHGEWINVPSSSVVTEPNRYGPAVVWPYMDTDGNVYIRCFLPGAGI
jgi:hypothetical protein